MFKRKKQAPAPTDLRKRNELYVAAVLVTERWKRLSQVQLLKSATREMKRQAELDLELALSDLDMRCWSIYYGGWADNK